MESINTITMPNIQSRKIKLNVYQRLIDYLFKPMTLGRLTIKLPDGSELVYGQGKNTVEACIQVKDNNFFMGMTDDEIMVNKSNFI